MDFDIFDYMHPDELPDYNHMKYYEFTYTPKERYKKPLLPFNPKTALIGIILTIAVLLLLCFFPTGVHAQSRKHKLVHGGTYKGHTADYAHVQKKKAYRTRQPSKALAFWRDLKREVRHALNDVFMAPAHSTPVPYNSIAVQQ